MLRRNILKAGAVGLTVSVAGCISGGDDDDSGGGTNIGLIYGRGGTGDQSFNDAAHRGIEQAVEEFDISYDDAGPQSSGDFGEFQSQYARSTDPDYDLVICLGFEHVSPLEDNADEYEDQQWALLDDVLDRPNVESWVYAEQHGAYMAGEVAAKLSSQEFAAGAAETNPDEKTLGFVGGAEVPVVQAFEAGFRAGAQSVDEEFEVRSSYVGGFDSPGDVEEAAISMIDSGADVLLHGAGAGGSGLFQACQDRGRFAMGADSRQSETAPEFSDVILGSIMKGVDASVVSAVERVIEGEYEGGETFELGVGEDGVELLWGVDIGDDIPQDIRDGADETAQAIADGDIDVPRTP